MHEPYSHDAVDIAAVPGGMGETLVIMQLIVQLS